MKEYKRKRLAEEWSSDIRPTKIKKQLNSSERWRGKQIIKKQLNDSHLPLLDKGEVQELRWNMEVEHGSTCYDKEINSLEHHLSTTLKRLGLVGWNWTLYKCTCENIDNLSDEEILKRNGY